jgi:PKD repeat protein
MKRVGFFLAVAVGVVLSAEAQVVVDFSADVTLGRGPLDVVFTDATSTGGGTITAWAWQFGDGGTSALQNPSHTYTSPGSHSVTLTVTVLGVDYPLTQQRFINVADSSSLASGAVDLTAATVVVNPGTLPNAEAKAAVILTEEIQTRTVLAWSTTTAMPATGAVIAITSDRTASPPNPEGYTLFVEDGGGRTTVWVLGNDARGAMFGVGALLRAMEWSAGSAVLPGPPNVTTAPVYPLRGHQIGYRHTNNTCDAWDKAAYEQHIRELVVFGTNAIENTFSADVSPHYPPSQTQIHIDLSDICEDYDVDYWLWAPVESSLPGGAAAELARHETLYQQLTRLDAVMVPGGDPGNNAPLDVMAFLEDLGTLLRSYFPDAELWVSNQGFEDAENDAFFNYLQTQLPDWLTGVVYGPWTKLSMADERSRTPGKYPIRHYPDLTHNVRCQFPQKDIDRSFAHVLGREAINPRPLANIVQHDVNAASTVGFVAYSDGVHDDVNKCVWSMRGWDSTASADAILLDYARFFFGPAVATGAKDGILALEDNWTHPALTNTGIDTTYAAWTALEASYPGLSGNWRWKLCLTRAYYDMFVRYRVIDEAAFEQQAYASLAQAGTVGSATAMANATAELAQAAVLSPAQQARRTRILDLCDELWTAIGFQPSVNAPYLGRGLERGCIMDTIDHPVNDRPFLENVFVGTAALPTEAERVAYLDAIVNWEDPGVGGFYDDLGDVARQPHLVQQLPWDQDPGRVESTGQEFSWHNMDYANLEKGGGRLSWQDQAYTLYGQPLQMQYTGLDPVAGYHLKGTYAGRFKPTMTCTADGVYAVHGAVAYQVYPPYEFAVPPAATRDGTLNLQWDLVSGRGCQLAETWLIVDDTDGDGVSDASDPDDDNDGIPDGTDTFPQDTDNDGVTNFDDPDNDGDGASDLVEIAAGTDPLDPGDTAPVLEVTPSSRAVGAASGTTTFNVANGGDGTLSWTASVMSGASWLSIQSGSNGTGTGVITVSFTNNALTTSRVGTVQVSAAGALSSPQTVTVTQAPNTTPVLQVTPANNDVAYTSGSTLFSIQNAGVGALNWSASVTPGASWLAIASPSSGTGNATLALNVSENTSGAARTGTVTVTAPGAVGSPASVTVTQAGAPTPQLSVSPATQTTGYGAGSTVFSVQNFGTGIMNWSAAITSGSDWANITSGSSGTQNGTIAVSYSENPAGVSRTAQVTVTAPGALGSPATVQLTQFRNSSIELSVLPSIREVGSAAGTATFTVSNPGGGVLNWTAAVATKSSWLTILSGQTGTGSGDIVVQHEANASGAIRNGSIEVASPGAINSPTLVSVRQDCAAPGIPTGVSASDGTYPDRVRVTWNPVVGATQYRVYRADTNNFASAAISGWQTGTTLDDFSAAVNPTDTGGCQGGGGSQPTWYYWVTALSDCAESGPSVSDQGRAGGSKSLSESGNCRARMLPSAPVGDGTLLMAAVDSPLFIRLHDTESIVPESVRGEVTGGGVQADLVFWLPVDDETVNDGWAAFWPTGAWPDDTVLTVTATANTASGRQIEPVSYQFVTGQKAEVGAIDQPGYAEFDMGSLDLSVESDDIASVSLAPAEEEPPPLATGVGPVYRIGPDEVFADPQRVWLPVPDGYEPGEVRVYFHQPVGDDSGWYEAGRVEGWAVPDSYLATDLDGAAWIGFVVRHAGTVQLGLPEEPEPVSRAGLGSVLLLAAVPLSLAITRGIPRRKGSAGSIWSRRL